eukprot:7113-Pelagococcus_subviridis.AAC.1
MFRPPPPMMRSTPVSALYDAVSAATVALRLFDAVAAPPAPRGPNGDPPGGNDRSPSAIAPPSNVRVVRPYRCEWRDFIDVVVSPPTSARVVRVGRPVAS